MVKKFALHVVAALGLASLSLTPAVAANLTVKDGNGNAQTMCAAAQSDSSLAYCMQYHDSTGAQVDLATKANQATANTSLGTMAGTVSTTGTPASTATTVQAATLPLPTGAAADATLQSIKTLLGSAPAQVGGKIDTVINGTATDIGASVTAATATTLAAANPTRRGFSIQNQTTGACYINSTTTATADYHSLLVAASAYYETKDSHVGTGAISVICVAAGGVYGRQW